MARIRTIKPEFFRHEGLFEAEREEGLPLRLAYAGLWTAADREGRFRWSPRALKLDCLPYDDVDFSRVLDALCTRGFIVKYTAENQLYGAIPSWHTHQAVNNRERASDLPEPNKNNILTCQPRVSDASASRLDPAPVEGKGKEGKGKEDSSVPTERPPDVGGPDSKPEKPPDATADAQLYTRGREVLGKAAGGIVTELKKHFGGNIALARASLEQASTKHDPREYLGAIIRGKRPDQADKAHLAGGLWDKGL
jgi:hypothetical protein